MAESIVSYLLNAGRKSEAEFASLYPECVLVVDPFAEADDGHFRTQYVDSGKGTDYTVAPLKKREGANAFGMMITIGRAANNDVVLGSKDVSKFHAFVKFDLDGNPSLADAGSTFGTVVGGQKLEPHTDIPLANGSRIRIGSLKLTFYTPEGFRSFLLNMS